MPYSKLEMQTSLIPATQSAAEIKISRRILALNPGLAAHSGKVSKAAELLSDSGLAPTVASMVIAAVYSSTDLQGRGQSTRARWFVEAVHNRYGHRLDMIRNDPKHLESFLYDMEVMSEIRDSLNGEGFSCSFHAAFLLWELGETTESITDLLEELYPSRLAYKGSAMAVVVRAAQLVKAGKFCELATAIQELRCGYG